MHGTARQLVAWEQAYEVTSRYIVAHKHLRQSDDSDTFQSRRAQGVPIIGA